MPSAVGRRRIQPAADDVPELQAESVLQAAAQGLIKEMAMKMFRRLECSLRPLTRRSRYAALDQATAGDVLGVALDGAGERVANTDIRFCIRDAILNNKIDKLRTTDEYSKELVEPDMQDNVMLRRGGTSSVDASTIPS
ncbi:hypothetical protein EJB05_06643 [Eragrostis curvula]|uniref:Uncharacterized protein n=1 Tax=Eragrostis curvula TaxID=38414 RepID=A0A5J9WG88_9POAL|nr:hypothetical protein EJB05_06643 [Eragrostis curvula]